MAEIRCAIEIRQDGEQAGPGRLYGTLMRYGTLAGDRPERFALGALSWPDGGIVVNEQHNRAAPIMRAIPEVRGDQVVIDSPIPDTQRGRDAATMIRSGVFRGLSVEFKATDEGRPGGVREIRAARLLAAGLVDKPSYPDAGVEVRRERPPEVLTWL